MKTRVPSQELNQDSINRVCVGSREPIYHAQYLDAQEFEQSIHNGVSLYHVGATCCITHLLEHRQIRPVEPLPERLDD